MYGTEGGGDRGLLAATLLQAIADRRGAIPYRVREAEKWFASDWEGPFTFRWTCLYLGLDPGAVRRAVGIRGGGTSSLGSPKPGRCAAKPG